MLITRALSRFALKREGGLALFEILFALALATSAAALTLHLQAASLAHLNRALSQMRATKNHLSFSLEQSQDCRTGENNKLRYLQCGKKSFMPFLKDTGFIIVLD